MAVSKAAKDGPGKRQVFLDELSQALTNPQSDGKAPVCPCGRPKPDPACLLPPMGQAGVVEHLQDIVRQSVADGNMQHALKAIELLGKHLGMFRERAAEKDEQGAEIRVNLDLKGTGEREEPES